MNAFKTLALAAAMAVPVISLADVPIVERVGKPAAIKCGVSAAGAAVNAAHADKIIFVLSQGLPAIDPADQGALNAVPRDTELDIKVLDNPQRIADLRGKVLSFIGAVDNAATRQQVRIIHVEYAMVCPNTGNPL